MRAYSEDLRLRILEACDSGLTVREVSENYNVSEDFIYRLKRLKKTTGLIKSKKQGGHRKPKLLPYHKDLEALVKATPDITLEELQIALSELGIKTNPTTIWRRLEALGLSYKKNITRSRAGQSRRQRAARGMA